METDKLTIWLEKYWEGETSLEQEKYIRDAFRKGNVPSELEVYRDHFTFFDTISKDGIMDPDFDDNILEQIEAQEQNYAARFRFIKRGWRVAAAILLAAGAFAMMQSLPGPETGNNAISYDSPGQEEQAYEQTRKALLLVSQKINKGQEETVRAGEILESASLSFIRTSDNNN